MSDHLELESLTRALAGELARRARHGQRHVEPLPTQPSAEPTPRPTPRPTPSPRAAAPPTKPQAPAPTPAPAVPKPVHRRQHTQHGPADIEAQRRSLAQCIDCGLSAGPRGSGALVGRGAARPLLVFVTDFAGPAERRYGKVLAPEAGQMIANMVTKGFGLQLSQIYVTAAVKCPLGQGCRPSPKETKACARHLAIELELLQPRTIVAFGALAAAALGWSDPGGLASLRGRTLQYMERTPLVVTSHPRDMLADTSLKAVAWQDLQLLVPHLTAR